VLGAQKSIGGIIVRIMSVVLAVSLPVTCFGYLAVDLNFDGTVDFHDFALFAGQWLAHIEDPNNIAANPMFEFNSNSHELVVKRDSAAVQEEAGNFTDIVANEVRTDSVCVTSFLTLGEVFTYRPLATDSVRGVVLCSDSVESTSRATKLYKTENGGDFAEIINIITDEPFKTYYDDMSGSDKGVAIWSAKVLDDGSWLLGIGIYDDHIDGKPSGRIFRSIDAGATWTKVLDMTYGYVPDWGWGGVDDNYITVGEYGMRIQSVDTDNPRKIYLSDDYGATWECIYTPDAYNGRHTHQVVFDPASNHTGIYVSTGDVTAGYLEATSLYRIDKQVDGTWGFTKIALIEQPVGALTVCNSIYWGMDKVRRGGRVMKHWRDAGIDKFCPLLALKSGYVFSIYHYNGVYYATVSASSENNGIYVSTDLKSWVCAHNSGDVSLILIAGYANGKLWVSCYDTVFKGFPFDPVTAKTVNAMRCERGVVNIYNTADRSTFATNAGDWYLTHAGLGNNTGYSTEESLHGGSSLKIEWKTDYEGAYIEAISPYMSNIGGLPNKGDIMTFSLWMKAADTWPGKYSVDILLKYGGDAASKVSYNYLQGRLFAAGCWRKYVMKVEVTDSFTGADNLALMLRFYRNGATTTNDATVYVDCLQVTYSPNRFYSSSTFQVGGTERVDESMILPLCGTGDVFTTTLEWQPKSRRTDFLADIPIATWLGADGSYLNLFWEQSSGLIKLTDGTGTIASVGMTYTFRFADYIRFGLVSDPNGSVLHVQDPANGTVIVGDGTNVKLTAEPILLELGTDENENDFGCGCFCNIRVWAQKLSEQEIAEVFDSPD
jgi:hypothetical protein